MQGPAVPLLRPDGRFWRPICRRRGRGRTAHHPNPALCGKSHPSSPYYSMLYVIENKTIVVIPALHAGDPTCASYIQPFYTFSLRNDLPMLSVLLQLSATKLIIIPASIPVVDSFFIRRDPDKERNQVDSWPNILIFRGYVRGRLCQNAAGICPAWAGKRICNRLGAGVHAESCGSRYWASCDRAGALRCGTERQGHL